MIDSSKKQQQGFSEILPAGDLKPLKEKECLEVNSQKSLKEGQSLAHLLLGGRRMQKSWAHSVHRHV